MDGGSKTQDGWDGQSSKTTRCARGVTLIIAHHWQFIVSYIVITNYFDKAHSLDTADAGKIHRERFIDNDGEMTRPWIINICTSRLCTRICKNIDENDKE
jgi:hypothetical protein